jgi:hypothetical protein
MLRDRGRSGESEDREAVPLDQAKYGLSGNAQLELGQAQNGA